MQKSPPQGTIASHKETWTSQGPRPKNGLQKLRSLPEIIAGADADVDGEGFSPLGAAVVGLEEEGAAS